LAILQKQQKGEGYSPPITWKIADTSIPPTTETNLSLENNSFDVTSELEDLSAENEDDDVVNELLSLDDLDLELESPSQEREQKEQIVTGQENMAKPAKNDEDWGDWLEEDSTEANSRVIGLDDIEIEQVQDWEAEDWGDDTVASSK
jgi:hypothetical protein